MPRAADRPPAQEPSDAQQHDLAADAARRIIVATGAGGGDSVLEIGPGLGALTAEMLARGARIEAVERDAARVAALRQRFANALRDGVLRLHEGDARTLVPPQSGRWRAVANPPFNLTALLLQRWLVSETAPVAIDLLLQRQAAEKLVGLPEGQTRSSVLVQLAGRSHISLRLRRDDTTPPSRVDLALWSFRRAEDAPPAAELARIDRLLAIAFAGPHTMTMALRGVASGIQLRRQGHEHGWSPDAHPRMLPPPAWRPLAALLAMCGKL